MTIVVTGGAGFIGANFIFYLHEHHPSWKIVCVDKLTYAGNLSTLKGMLKTPGFRFERIDICDRQSVRRLFEETRPDVVVHFAAESHVDRSIFDPEVFVRTNVLGTAVLLDVSREFSVARFHQVSTDEVYGDLPLDRPDLRFTETTPIHAHSPYSASKASADLLALAYARTYGLPVTVSRCSNNYGPYQFPEKLIPLMTINGLEGRPLPVYGKGQNVRDWIHVSDHCAAIDRILESGRPGEVYNVGGNSERSNIEIVRLICGELGIPESRIQYVADRKGHDLRYAIDGSKIRTELGWSPGVPFEEGMRQTIRWYVGHEDWWRSVINQDYLDYYERMYASRC